MSAAAWLPAHSSQALTAEGDAKATTCAALAIARSAAGTDWTGTVLYVFSLSTAKPLAERPACTAHRCTTSVHADAAGQITCQAMLPHLQGTACFGGGRIQHMPSAQHGKLCSQVLRIGLQIVHTLSRNFFAVPRCVCQSACKNDRPQQVRRTQPHSEDQHTLLGVNATSRSSVSGSAAAVPPPTTANLTCQQDIALGKRSRSKGSGDGICHQNAGLARQGPLTCSNPNDTISRHI